MSKNQIARESYGQEHVYKPLFGFWDYIFFTDEAHVDPTSQCVGDVLRERGKRYDDENIKKRPPLKGVRFHIAAWINWYGKGSKLEFYNDEEDHVEQPKMPSKPRRRPITETESEYQERLKEWEATKPYDIEVKVKGNAMTQKYYVERLLPVYCKAVKAARLIDEKQWYL